MTRFKLSQHADVSYVIQPFGARELFEYPVIEL